ncbi:MAG: hypothetical protein OEO83_08165 [Alphaproteobacteria bacterium]|nr:hypothetical protein [Alphaproteobacteria bacterium]
MTKPSSKNWKNVACRKPHRSTGWWARTALLLTLAAVSTLVLGGAAEVGAADAKKPKVTGYVAFARLSNSEKVLAAETCREYGGRPVEGREQDQVMRAGRTDKWFYNVLWFGQHQYVTYKRDTSATITGKIGLHPYSVSLCQF